MFHETHCGYRPQIKHQDEMITISELTISQMFSARLKSLSHQTLNDILRPECWSLRERTFNQALRETPVLCEAVTNPLSLYYGFSFTNGEHLSVTEITALVSAEIEGRNQCPYPTS